MNDEPGNWDTVAILCLLVWGVIMVVGTVIGIGIAIELWPRITLPALGLAFIGLTLLSVYKSLKGAAS